MISYILQYPDWKAIRPSILSESWEYPALTTATVDHVMKFYVIRSANWDL